MVSGSHRCTNGPRTTDALYGTMLGTRIARMRTRMAMIINQPQRRCCGALSAQPASVITARGLCVWSMLAPFVLPCPDRAIRILLNARARCRARSLMPVVACTWLRGTISRARGFHSEKVSVGIICRTAGHLSLIYFRNLKSRDCRCFTAVTYGGTL